MEILLIALYKSNCCKYRNPSYGYNMTDGGDGTVGRVCSEETKQKRKISHLTLNWFMQTLLDRSDRMAMYNGFEIRVPFCDYRLAQYVWNIPWEIKALKGREKGLLRYAYKDILPEEIVYRKKSPYPKTFNPSYMLKVKEKLLEILNNDKSKIHNLFDKEFMYFSRFAGVFFLFPSQSIYSSSNVKISPIL